MSMDLKDACLEAVPVHQLGLKILARSKVSNSFELRFAGIPTIAVYSFESPRASFCLCSNTFRLVLDEDMENFEALNCLTLFFIDFTTARKDNG